MISDRHHGALASLRLGHGDGDGDHVQVLVFSVYVAYLMECSHVDAKPDPAPSRAAIAALEQCWMRAQAGDGFSLDDGGIQSLAALLTLHDGQLDRYRSHCHDETRAAIMKAAFARVSPLADGNVLPSGSPTVFWLVPAGAVPADS